MNTDTPRTDEAAVDVWRKSNGERMETSSDKVDADFARQLERELNDARAEMIRWMSIAEGRGRTDDEASVYQELNDANERMGKKLAQTLDERDMLAEALRKVARSWNYAEVAQQALQSLTPKP
jgi:hypothetical protein